MKCPYCDHSDDRVVDSRESREGRVIRRRRECLGCERRFTTYEQIEDVPLSAWETVIGINVRGVFLMSRAAVPHMKARGYGRIVSMASLAGLQALPERAAYCASKAAVIGMTRSLAYDLAPHGITVNCVCPGSIRTDRAISSTLRAGWTDVDAGLAERAKVIPVGRHGLPEEIAATVAHLASEEAGFIIGQAILVDGGGLPPSTF